MCDDRNKIDLVTGRKQEKEEGEEMIKVKRTLVILLLQFNAIQLCIVIMWVLIN